MTMTDVEIHPAIGPFVDSVRVPGDKSLSHRALIFAAMAAGTCRVGGLGTGGDIVATAGVLRALGVDVRPGMVISPGVDCWAAPDGPLYCGNSGTTLRLMAGALCARPFRSTLAGDESLNARPMDRLVGPLAALGAAVATSGSGTPPVTVGGTELTGADVILPLASAQVRSAVALAGLQAAGPTTISGPAGYRDHTERWLVAWDRGEWLDDGRFRVLPGPIPARDHTVPGDPSSAAFLWASAAIVAGARVTTPGISLNPGRLGFLEILESMGAGVEAEVSGTVNGDPVGSVTVTGEKLVAVAVEGDLIASSLDELPLVGVLGAYAEGITTVTDAAELRVKESDRIAATVDLIRSLGGGAEPAADGFSVVGTGFLSGGVVDARGDHRIAMAGAVAATAAAGPVTVTGGEVVAVSWPGFYEALEGLWSSR
jgi:3-phosphoshikimate 1-carboxyvinyltransferase